MQLGYIIIYVEDVQATIAFYERAFGIKLRFLHESNQYAEMETGKTALAFVNESFAMGTCSFRPNRRGEQAAGVEIAFVVDDVEEQFHRAVAAGAMGIAAPAQKPWGQMVCYVRDNNGFLVEICNAVNG